MSWAAREASVGIIPMGEGGAGAGGKFAEEDAGGVAGMVGRSGAAREQLREASVGRDSGGRRDVEDARWRAEGRGGESIG